MARLFLRKTLSGFAPADEQAQELHKSYKLGEIYRADVVKPRSWAHHKLIMALLTLTYRNLPERYEILWPSFDKFRKSVAFDVGHREETVLRDGTVIEGPGSLSYDALDEVEFTKVSAAMMTWCAETLDMSQPDLAAEVSRYADQHYGRAA